MLGVDRFVLFLGEVGHVGEVVEAVGQDKAIILLKVARVVINVEVLTA